MQPTLPLVLRGKVRQGDHLGRTLGYPTANIRLHNTTVRDGVYISETRLGDSWYPSATFIGAAKTFGQTKRLAESHLFDQQIDMYGRWISIRLLEFIRENKKFPSTNALVAAMRKDEAIARKYHSI